MISMKISESLCLSDALNTSYVQGFSGPFADKTVPQEIAIRQQIAISRHKMQGFPPADRYSGGEPYLINHSLCHSVLRILVIDKGSLCNRSGEGYACG